MATMSDCLSEDEGSIPFGTAMKLVINCKTVVSSLFGDVAQLAERYLCKVKDVGSTPIISTIKFN